ncbi:MAG: glycerol-3-phosphate dehydrogenase/oxidase [Gemmatimonadota bacterium]
MSGPMRRDPAALQGPEFDLVVIGGGIFGACAAREAARRGLSVALVERGDFSSATSAQSFKMVHGGMRYLQHADLKRVRQSSADRHTLLFIAPHLVRPLPIVVPTYGHGMRGKEALRAAMAVYDALTFDRNAGISDPGRRIPRGRCLSRTEVLEAYPGLPEPGLTGAGVFSDGQMINPPRLVLAFIRSAVESGAVVSNYVEAIRILVRDGRVEGVAARDVLTGDEILVRGRVVLNAAGPYAEGLLVRSGSPLAGWTPWSRDAYMVVDRPLVPGSGALALPAQTNDPDAVLSRGPRHLFLVPWKGATLVGVWHAVYEGEPDDYTVHESELRGFLDEINAAYAGLDLTLDDVSLWNAGLIPFGENDPSAKDLRFGHRSRLVDHAAEHGVQGLVTLIGVRYTTGPSDAARAVELALEKLGRQAVPPEPAPVHGGDVPDVAGLVDRVLAGAPRTIPPAALRALAQNHGSEVDRVLGLARDRPDLARTIGGSTVLRAEAVHAVREEMAVTLGDVVLRRTDLGTARYPGDAALLECLALVADEAGWDAARREREMERVQEAFPPKLRAAYVPSERPIAVARDRDEKG